MCFVHKIKILWRRCVGDISYAWFVLLLNVHANNAFVILNILHKLYKHRLLRKVFTILFIISSASVPHANHGHINPQAFSFHHAAIPFTEFVIIIIISFRQFVKRSVRYVVRIELLGACCARNVSNNRSASIFISHSTTRWKNRCTREEWYFTRTYFFLLIKNGCQRPRLRSWIAFGNTIDKWESLFTKGDFFS